MLIGYARTSTVEQQAGFDDQISQLKDHGCDKLFSEQVSSVAERRELEEAVDYIREGDTLVVTRLDRLARSTVQALDIVERLNAKDASLVILDFGGQPLDTRSPTGTMALTMFAAMAQFERELLLERQKAGIAAAKAAGKYKGRAPTAKRKSADVIRLKAMGRGPMEIAKELGISRASVYRILAVA